MDIDVLFFVSDEFVVGVVMECNRWGIKFGKDIDICGFNDLSFVCLIYFVLIIVLVLCCKMVEMVVELLILLIEGEDVE